MQLIRQSVMVWLTCHDDGCLADCLLILRSSEFIVVTVLTVLFVLLRFAVRGGDVGNLSAPTSFLKRQSCSNSAVVMEKTGHGCPTLRQHFQKGGLHHTTNINVPNKEFFSYDESGFGTLRTAPTRLAVVMDHCEFVACDKLWY